MREDARKEGRDISEDVRYCGGGGGIQRNTKEEQTAAGLLALTWLFAVYSI